MRTGRPAGLKAASEKHMATRWSSYVWMRAVFQWAGVAGGVTRMKSAPFFHRGAQLSQFVGHGGNPIGFLDAPAGDIAQRGGAVGIERHHAQCHRGVGNVVAVEVDGLQGPGAACDFKPVRAARHVCAHGLGRLDEADVTLDRCRPHTLDADALAVRAGCNQRTEADEIAGGRCVGLDMDLSRRLVAAAGRNDETLPALAAYGNAEPCQQVQGDLDVGLGDSVRPPPRSRWSRAASPCMEARCPASGSAISSAVRNWPGTRRRAREPARPAAARAGQCAAADNLPHRCR
jgi:hypothetical protein